jgi:hypothetical protein
MLGPKTIVVVCFLVVALFLVFALVAFNADGAFRETGIVATTAKMEFAMAWTLRAAGSLITIIAAIHLVRFAGQRDAAEQVVPGGIALLGGLLLLGQQHWVVVTAFGVLILAFIIQQLLMRRAPLKPVATERGGFNKIPAVEEAVVTGIQVGRG